MNKLRVYRSSGALISSTFLPAGHGRLHSGTNRTAGAGSAHHRAETLFKQMTAEEKVGQLNQSAGVVMPGLATDKPDLHRQGQVGSILWQIEVNEMNRLQHLAVEKSRLHIPILFGFDVIHGYRTIFPVPLAMASSWDPAVGGSRNASCPGCACCRHPVDIHADGRYRTRRPLGPHRGRRGRKSLSRFGHGGGAGARISGRIVGPNSVLACVKHFAGYGAAEGGRDYDSSYIPEVLLRNVYLVPFHAAEKAGAATFMSAYMDLNDVPATGNRWLLHDVLRQEWGFKGFVVSDALAVGNLETHGYARNPEDAALKAFTAGLNMDMASLTYIHNLPKLVASGKVSEAQLDAAVMPILEAKYQLGLFGHPYVDESKVEAQLTSPAGRALERKLAARSMVLLKNDNHTLPLTKNLKKVAVIGSLADSTKDIEGGWTVEGLFGDASKSHPVTVLAGLKEKLGPNVQVTYVAGATPTREYPSMIDPSLGQKSRPRPQRKR